MKCYLCGKSKVEVIRKKIRFDITRDVLKCESCGLVYLRPKTFDSRSFYGAEYRKTHTPVINKVLNSRQTFDIYSPFQKFRIDLLKGVLKPGMKILDIGCSSGHFLYAVKKAIKTGEFVGIDYNLENVDFINKELKFKAYTKPVEETGLPTKYFDLITVMHTLEHIEDPISFLRGVAKYLKPGGQIYLEVPNINEALMTLYQVEEYAGFQFKESHLFYYSPDTLQRVTEKAGLRGKVTSIQRMNFLNHLNWMFARKPQAGPHVHMADPVLITSDTAASVPKIALNTWIKKVDLEYRKLLNKYDIGESIYFLGRPAKH